MSEWQDISTAPKDGTHFLVWGGGLKWPAVVRWHRYGAKTAQEAGKDGFWTYQDELPADPCGDLAAEGWAIWMPITPPGDQP